MTWTGHRSEECLNKSRIGCPGTEPPEFSWGDARASLRGLSDGGLNIAFEALDRNIASGRGDAVASTPSLAPLDFPPIHVYGFSDSCREEPLWGTPSLLVRRVRSHGRPNPSAPRVWPRCPRRRPLRT